MTCQVVVAEMIAVRALASRQRSYVTVVIRLTDAISPHCSSTFLKWRLAPDVVGVLLTCTFRLSTLGRQNRPAELLAKFLDVKLKGEKGMSDDDVEGILDKVMVLFR